MKIKSSPFFNVNICSRIICFRHAQVGAGIANDAVKVFKDYNVSIKAVEDLSYLANQKLGGGPHQWGLGSLTKKLISKEVIYLGFSEN